MKFVEEFRDNFSKELDDARILLLSGCDRAMQKQVIAQFAIKSERGISEWTFLGFMQDIQIVEVNGQPEIRKIENQITITDPIEAMKSIEDKLDSDEVFMFDLISEENLTEEIVDALSKLAPKMVSSNARVLVTFNTEGNEETYAEREDIKQLLAHKAVSRIHYGFMEDPAIRKEAIVDILQKIVEIKGGDDVINPETGEVSRINFDFQNEEDLQKEPWLAELVDASEGISLTQIGGAIALSLTANEGQINPDMIVREAKFFKDMNMGTIDPDFFQGRIQDSQKANKWVGEENYFGYAFRALVEYIYARYVCIHFVTGQDGGESILIQDLLSLLSVMPDKISQAQAPKRLRKSVAIYNSQTKQVEKIDVFEDAYQEADSGDKEENFVSLKELTDANKTIEPLDMLKWFMETPDDYFVLWMKDFVPSTPQEEAAMQYILKVEQISKKTLLTSHESHTGTKNMVGDAGAVFFLDNI